MKRSFLATILVLTISLAVIYLFVKEASQVYALYQENEKTKSKVEELSIANQELKKRIGLLDHDDQYIEKTARDELGMIKEGEKIYRFEE